MAMMETNKIISRGNDDKSTLASVFGSPTRVGFDGLDGLALSCIPAAVRGDSEKVLIAQLNTLVAEGGRGPTMRRLLSREVGLARASARYAQSLLHVELANLGKRHGHAERVERIAVLERTTDAAHRRLLAAVDRLLRLDTVPVPRIRVSARQAQVNIGEVAQ